MSHKHKHRSRRSPCRKSARMAALRRQALCSFQAWGPIASTVARCVRIGIKRSHVSRYFSIFRPRPPPPHAAAATQTRQAFALDLAHSRRENCGVHCIGLCPLAGCQFVAEYSGSLLVTRRGACRWWRLRANENKEKKRIPKNFWIFRTLACVQTEKWGVS